jgi:two-component system nitrogen regulation response regulator GlnG/two-component system response regulator HydG
MPGATDTLSETQHPEIASELSDSMGIAIAWSAEEPDRVGEVALVPGGEPGPVQILGRGGPDADDNAARLAFARMRGSRVEPRPPLENPRLSRAQLRIRVIGDGALELENVGRLGLEQGGVETTRAIVRPGDMFQLGRQLLFVVVRRSVPQRVPEGACRPRDFPFGAADADGMVGESAAVWALRERIAFVGPRRGHVLIVGPSGTGKELVARAVHAASPRAGRDLVARNAPTIPEGIVDAELFGNARNYPNVGAPERSGLVGEADGTSLFLDEFGELPVSIQAHLLRVLDSGEYQRLGETRMRTSDLRLIAATNRPTSALKDDLLARLAFRIEVPGLDARKEDVPLLARHLVKRILAGDPALARRFPAPLALSAGFVRDLLAVTYTTNARELEAVLWRALERHPGGDVLEPAPDWRAPSRDRNADPVYGSDGRPGADEGFTAEAIQRCLDAHNGVLEDTWRELGLSSRHALARLVRKLGVEIRKRPRA